MAAHGVRWAMPEGDEPVCRVSFQICTQPCEHRPIRTSIGRFRIQANEMDVRVVEGVILFRARWNSPGLTHRGKREDIKEGQRSSGRDAVRLVIPHGGPERCISKYRRVDIEEKPTLYSASVPKKYALSPRANRHLRDRSSQTCNRHPALRVDALHQRRKAPQSPIAQMRVRFRLPGMG